MAIPVYLRVYPSGDFSLYPEPKPRPSKPPQDFQEALSPLGLSHPVKCHNPPSDILNNGEESQNDEHFSDSLLTINGGAGRGDRPDLDSQPSRPPRAPRGSGGLTTEAARIVRSSCQLLDEIAAGRPIAMLTLTLPFCDRAQLDLATENWSEIMRQYMQELSREMTRVMLPVLWVFTTEWQRRGALHAHIAFIAHPTLLRPRGSEYPIKKEWYRDTWRRILFNVLGQDLNCNSATRIEKVRTHIGAYLSKYISKGDRPMRVNEAANNHAHTFPASNAHMDFAGCAYRLSPRGKGFKVIVRKQSSAIVYSEVQYSTVPDSTSHDTTLQCIHTLGGCIQDDAHGSVKHPTTWWGACTKLKKAVKARVEIWRIKLREGVQFRPCPRCDEWLERAGQVMKKVDVYWQRIVCSGGEIPRAITGRVRQKSGWKDKLLETLLGGEISRELFKKSEKYWSWRWQRDGCVPDSDAVAEAEWIAKVKGASVTVGI